MGTSSSSLTPQQQKDQQQQEFINTLAHEIRLVLRMPDGPSTSSSSSPQQQQAEQQPQQLHRSQRLRALLEKATPSCITTEHMLELVDNRWEEAHDEIPTAIDELVTLAQRPQLQTLAVACLLNQRCWHALRQSLLALLTTTTKTSPSSTSSSSSAIALGFERMFVQACEAAPIDCIRLVLELGWIGTGSSDSAASSCAAEQFRVLMFRFCREHKAPVSAEEKAKKEAEKRKKGALFQVNDADGQEEAAKAEQKRRLSRQNTAEDSFNLLKMFLHKIAEPVPADTVRAAIEALPVHSNTDNNDDVLTQAQNEMDAKACKLLRAALTSHVSPWSQLESTVDETPMSWLVAHSAMRKRVVNIAGCLKRRGLTFPGWARVLSFLVTPGSSVDAC